MYSTCSIEVFKLITQEIQFRILRNAVLCDLFINILYPL